MISPEFANVQLEIERFAKAKQHQFILVEHLLWGLLDNADIQALMQALHVDVKRLKTELLSYFEQYAIKTQVSNYVPVPTAAVDRVMRRAIFHLQSSGQNREVACSDVLVALFTEKDNYAVKILRLQGLERIRLLRYLSHHQHDTAKQTVDDFDDSQFDETKHKKTKKGDVLARYTQNLNERAKQGLIDPLVGRQAEIERVAQILVRRRKNNPLLVGDTGVGKTAIVEGLAWLIVQGKTFDMLKDTVIYSLDLGSLVAGTKYRGDFEERIKSLLDVLKNKPNAILFVDEIHTIIGAGSSMESKMDVSNLIKPALSNGELRCIGSTTFSEFRQVFEHDNALSRRFQKIDVAEPSDDDTVAILRGLKPKYEAFHHVVYSDDVLQAMVSLSVKYIHGRFLPDKAIDVMDEVGARQKLAQVSLADNADVNDGVDDSDDTNRQPTPIVIDVGMVEEVVASMARIPPKSVSQDDLGVLKNLGDDLKRTVFGQDKAVACLVDAIKLARAGLKAVEKPIGSFLFAGPTGVGKTEICRQLAKLLGVNFVRFDMSEYMEAHTVSRLIGSPPGYVGHDKGGLLTEKIQQNPHCVLLLDELEKAHDDVFNLLLQVMDYGNLTDSNGRTVSFRQVILVMTTNVGAEALSRVPIGFVRADVSLDNQAAIKKAFSPEFRNRLDAIVHFSPLSEQAVSAVVDKFLASLQVLLDDKGVVLDVRPAARQYLANKGYDVQMGARPMARLIDDELKKPLSDMLLFGELAKGGTVVVDVLDDQLQLAVETAPALVVA